MTTVVDPPTRPRGNPYVAVGVVTAIALVAVVPVLLLPRLAPETTAVGDIGELQPGVPVQGRLVRAQPAIFEFEGRAGQRVVIEMRRRVDGLDPILRLHGPSGELIAEDDDGGGELNSRIRATLESDGTHIVEAGGLGGSVGAYTLSLTLRERAGDPVVVVDVDGELTPEQPTARYEFEARGGQVAVVAMNDRGASGLDSLVRLYGPDGALVGENDDGPSSLDSLLDVSLPSDGTYVVEASGLGGSLGTYSLTVELS